MLTISTAATVLLLSCELLLMFTKKTPKSAEIWTDRDLLTLWPTDVKNGVGVGPQFASLSQTDFCYTVDVVSHQGGSRHGHSTPGVHWHDDWQGRVESVHGGRDWHIICRCDDTNDLPVDRDELSRFMEEEIGTSSPGVMTLTTYLLTGTSWAGSWRKRWAHRLQVWWH